jgi:hypothetical protein
MLQSHFNVDERRRVKEEDICQSGEVEESSVPLDFDVSCCHDTQILSFSH